MYNGIQSLKCITFNEAPSAAVTATNLLGQVST